MKQGVLHYVPQYEKDQPLYVEMAGIDECQPHYKIVRRPSGVTVIGYVLTGAGTFQIDGRLFTANAGDAFVAPAGTEQMYYPADAGEWTFVWMNVRGPLVLELLRAYDLRNRYLYPSASVESLLRKALSLAELKNAKDIARLHKSLNVVVAEIVMELAFSSKRTARAELSPEVVKIKNFIDRNVERHITLDDLSEVSSLTKRHLTRVFRKEVGTTPYDYLLSHKIELAKTLLLNTNLTVAEIASKLQFADPYYFSNFFKRKTGFPPSRFRKRADG